MEITSQVVEMEPQVVEIKIQVVEMDFQVVEKHPQVVEKFLYLQCLQSESFFRPEKFQRSQKPAASSCFCEVGETASEVGEFEAEVGEKASEVGEFGPDVGEKAREVVAKICYLQCSQSDPILPARKNSNDPLRSSP